MILSALGIITVIFAGILTFIYAYLKWESQYFEKRGVKQLPLMKIPFLGHLSPVFFKNTHYKDVLNEAYSAFPDEKYVGFFEFVNPRIILRDVELIKQITIKEFDSFHDHLNFLNWDTDPLFSKNLFSMKGDRWKDMRPALSPAFTSSKMRAMYEFIVECGEQCNDYFLDQWKNEKNANDVLEIDMKEPFKRFAADVIASCAFGFKLNSFSDRDNDFFKMAANAAQFTTSQVILSLLYLLKGKIFKNSQTSAFTEDVREFYRKLVTGTMKDREINNIIRPDMIHLLMQAKKGKLLSKFDENVSLSETGFATVDEYYDAKVTKWTDDELTAQAIIFIIGGFDTSSYLMAFMAYEMSLQPEIQRRLQWEIDEVYEANNGKVSYNDINSMKYMDMTVSETLRKWSQGFRLDRKCVKDFELPPPNASSNKKYKLKPGDGIWIPVNAIHHDPKYYPNPDKFDPERFSDENKHKINVLTYLPFGIGPRNCIGNRFALMETKAIMFHLLRTFDMLPTKKTHNPIKLDPKPLAMIVEGGFWVGLKKRNI